MRIGILFLLMAFSFSAGAQTLKEMLYGGKLKNNAGTIIRSTDDLTTKIDTLQDKPAVFVSDSSSLAAADGSDSLATEIPAMVNADAPVEKTGMPAEKEAISAPAETPAMETGDDELPAPEPEPEVPVVEAAPVKTNGRIWKEFADSLNVVLQQELLSNRKIKKGSYQIIVEHEIETDGQVNIINVMVSPDNDLLQSELKARFNYTSLQLNPITDSNGDPRKAKRRYSFYITKE